MVDTGLVFQIENERQREEEEIRQAEDNFWEEWERRAFAELQSQIDHAIELFDRQRELREWRDSPNLREHVPRMEK